MQCQTYSYLPCLCWYQIYTAWWQLKPKNMKPLVNWIYCFVDVNRWLRQWIWRFVWWIWSGWFWWIWSGWWWLLWLLMFLMHDTAPCHQLQVHQCSPAVLFIQFPSHTLLHYTKSGVGYCTLHVNNTEVLGRSCGNTWYDSVFAYRSWGKYNF